jgi:excisionase family DNA binding protein
MSALDLLTAKDAAPLADLHPVTLLRFAREGKVAVVKIGRKRRFRRADIEAFVEGNVCPAITPAPQVIPAQRPVRNPNRTYKT